METRVQPELVLKRRTCESCGEGTFEFDSDTASDTQVIQEYICTRCST